MKNLLHELLEIYSLQVYKNPPKRKNTNSNKKIYQNNKKYQHKKKNSLKFFVQKKKMGKIKLEKQNCKI